MRKGMACIILSLMIAIAGILGGRAMADRPDGSPTAVDVVLRPAWYTEMGKYKIVSGLSGVLAYGQNHTITYAPAAGKTLYITHVGIALFAVAADDGDKPQNFWAYLTVSGQSNYYFGGNAGMVFDLSIPYAVAYPYTGGLRVTNVSNHNVGALLTFAGYEE